MSETATATPAAGGGSILTSGVPDQAPQTQQQQAPPQTGIEAARQAAQRPEWAPEKYWDPEKGEVKFEDMGKGYSNLEKLLGREKVPVPTSEDDAEGWDRWYAASGRPGKLEEYEFHRPDKLPDGLQYDDDLHANYQKVAFANGLNKRQAANLYENFVKHQVDRHSAYQVSRVQAKQEVERAMQREHGAKYEAFLTDAKTAVGQYADPEFRQYLDETGLGNDPRMIRIFGKIGAQLKGDTRLSGKPQPTATPQDNQRVIAEFNSKYRDVLYNKEHPDHALRVKERTALYEAAFA